MKVVVIPATYNEKGNIEKLITLLEETVFPQIKEHTMQILVADDSSPDGTGDAVKELMKKWKNLHVNIGEKKGLGAAYIRAMTYAIEHMGADVVCEMDADLSHDPRAIPQFLKKMEEGNFDMVIGTRYSDGGSMPENWPFHRKAFSVVANLLIRSITFRFSLHDWTGGFRAIKKEVFLKERDKVRPFQGYTFQVAFLYKALLDGYRVGEVPIHFADRALGRSKIVPLEYILNLLTYVISERLRELQRFIKFLVVGGTGFLIQLLLQEGSVALSISHSVAAGIGAEGAILSNFLLNHFWTFTDSNKIKESGSFLKKLLKFNLASLASIGIQVASVWFFENILGTSIKLFAYNIPTRIVVLFPTIIFIVIPLNYIIYNKIIWKTQYLHDENRSKK